MKHLPDEKKKLDALVMALAKVLGTVAGEKEGKETYGQVSGETTIKATYGTGAQKSK